MNNMSQEYINDCRFSCLPPSHPPLLLLQSRKRFPFLLLFLLSRSAALEVERRKREEKQFQRRHLPPLLGNNKILSSDKSGEGEGRFAESQIGKTGGEEFDNCLSLKTQLFPYLTVKASTIFTQYFWGNSPLSNLELFRHHLLRTLSVLRVRATLQRCLPRSPAGW